MTTSHQVTQAASAAPQDSARPDEAATVPSSSFHDARLGRLDDYQLRSLAQEDALEANVAALNGGLMRVGLFLEESLLQAIEGSPPDLQRVDEIRPAIETQLRLARQIDRFAKFKIRAQQERQAISSGEVRSRSPVTALPEAEGVRSEDSGV